MRARESRAGVKVWATLPPAMLARVDALVPTMPEDERERHEPTRADVVRAALAGGGLAALEERAGRVTVKRAPLAKAGRGGR